MVRRLHAALILGAALLAALVLVACTGGGDDPTPTPTAPPSGAGDGLSLTTEPPEPIPPCDIVDPDAIEEILGVNIGGWSEFKQRSLASCTYDSNEGEVLELWIETGVSPEAFTAIIEQARAGGDEVETLPSVADETYWLPARDLLVARYQDAYIQIITLQSMPEDDRQ